MRSVRAQCGGGRVGGAFAKKKFRGGDELQLKFPEEAEPPPPLWIGSSLCAGSFCIAPKKLPSLNVTNVVWCYKRRKMKASATATGTVERGAEGTAGGLRGAVRVACACNSHGRIHALILTTPISFAWIALPLTPGCTLTHPHTHAQKKLHICAKVLRSSYRSTSTRETTLPLSSHANLPNTRSPPAHYHRPQRRRHRSPLLVGVLRHAARPQR